MRRKALAVGLLGVSLLLGGGAVSLAQRAGPKPRVFDVTPTTAQVTSIVTPPGNVGSYRFEWGTDETYGTRSEPIALGIERGAQAVGGTLTGLTPSTTYVVRVVVTGAGDPIVSPPATFTTSPAPTPVPAETTPAPSTMHPRGTPERTPDPARAVTGEAVVVGPETGTVSVKQAGTTRYARLVAGAPVPVGTLVDARRGSVRLITQIGEGGRSQDVLLGGGRFEVRQARNSGMTDLVLRGGSFSSCRRGRAAARKRARPRRSLWAKDRGGRFRTRGLNSVATVRGTAWRTTDTCRGTTTSVTEGSVVVRELGTRRKVVVREGERHLARTRR